MKSGYCLFLNIQYLSLAARFELLTVDGHACASGTVWLYHSHPEVRYDRLRESVR
jgi:hypothetical protein